MIRSSLINRLRRQQRLAQALIARHRMRTPPDAGAREPGLPIDWPGAAAPEFAAWDETDADEQPVDQASDWWTSIPPTMAPGQPALEAAPPPAPAGPLSGMNEQAWQPTPAQIASDLRPGARPPAPATLDPRAELIRRMKAPAGSPPVAAATTVEDAPAAPTEAPGTQEPPAVAQSADPRTDLIHRMGTQAQSSVDPAQQPGSAAAPPAPIRIRQPLGQRLVHMPGFNPALDAAGEIKHEQSAEAVAEGVAPAPNEPAHTIGSELGAAEPAPLADPEPPSTPAAPGLAEELSESIDARAAQDESQPAFRGDSSAHEWVARLTQTTSPAESSASGLASESGMAETTPRPLQVTSPATPALERQIEPAQPDAPPHTAPPAKDARASSRHESRADAVESATDRAAVARLATERASATEPPASSPPASEAQDTAQAIAPITDATPQEWAARLARPAGALKQAGSTTAPLHTDWPAAPLEEHTDRPADAPSHTEPATTATRHASPPAARVEEPTSRPTSEPDLVQTSTPVADATPQDWAARLARPAHAPSHTEQAITTTPSQANPTALVEGPTAQPPASEVQDAAQIIAPSADLTPNQVEQTAVAADQAKPPAAPVEEPTAHAPGSGAQDAAPVIAPVADATPQDWAARLARPAAMPNQADRAATTTPHLTDLPAQQPKATDPANEPQTARPPVEALNRPARIVSTDRRAPAPAIPTHEKRGETDDMPVSPHQWAARLAQSRPVEQRADDSASAATESGAPADPAPLGQAAVQSQLSSEPGSGEQAPRSSAMSRPVPPVPEHTAAPATTLGAGATAGPLSAHEITSQPSQVSAGQHAPISNAASEHELPASQAESRGIAEDVTPEASRRERSPSNRGSGADAVLSALEYDASIMQPDQPLPDQAASATLAAADSGVLADGRVAPQPAVPNPSQAAHAPANTARAAADSSPEAWARRLSPQNRPPEPAPAAQPAWPDSQYDGAPAPIAAGAQAGRRAQAPSELPALDRQTQPPMQKPPAGATPETVPPAAVGSPQAWAARLFAGEQRQPAPPPATATQPPRQDTPAPARQNSPTSAPRFIRPARAAAAVQSPAMAIDRAISKAQAPAVPFDMPSDRRAERDGGEPQAPLPLAEQPGQVRTPAEQNDNIAALDQSSPQAWAERLFGKQRPAERQAAHEQPGMASASGLQTALPPPGAAPTQLRQTTRRFLRPLLGFDPAATPVYHGGLADAVAANHAADGVAIGTAVFLAAGHAENAPETLGLLAHELTHVASRRAPRFVPPILRGAGVAPRDEERLAESVEVQVARAARLRDEQAFQVRPSGPSIAPSAPELGVPAQPASYDAPPHTSGAGQASWGGLPAPWEPLPSWMLAPAVPTPAPAQPNAGGWTSATTTQAPAAAPDIQRATYDRSAAIVAAPVITPRSTPPGAAQAPEPDLDALARQVYARLKQRLAAERRRSGS